MKRLLGIILLVFGAIAFFLAASATITSYLWPLCIIAAGVAMIRRKYTLVFLFLLLMLVFVSMQETGEEHLLLQGVNNDPWIEHLNLDVTFGNGVLRFGHQEEYLIMNAVQTTGNEPLIILERKNTSAHVRMVADEKPQDWNLSLRNIPTDLSVNLEEAEVEMQLQDLNVVRMHARVEKSDVVLVLGQTADVVLDADESNIYITVPGNQGVKIQTSLEASTIDAPGFTGTRTLVNNAFNPLGKNILLTISGESSNIHVATI